MHGWTHASVSDRATWRGLERGGLLRHAGTLVHAARRKPLGAMGGGLLLAVALLALAAPLLVTAGPTAIDADAALSPPSLQHPLGTDNLGRDVVSRVAYGARLSLAVGLLSVALGASVGAGVGLVSGYYGGSAVDATLQRLMDALLAFPTLILALAIVAARGPSAESVILALGVAQAPWVARVVRAQALAVAVTPYVEAARAVGCAPVRVVAFHVLPQCVAAFLVVSTAALGAAIVAEASLSFLGVGVPQPTPSWGSMLAARPATTSRPRRGWPWRLALPCRRRCSASTCWATRCGTCWTRGCGAARSGSGRGPGNAPRANGLPEPARPRSALRSG